MRIKSICVVLILIFCAFTRLCFADEITSSVWGGVGEGAHGDNGTLIIGVNKSSNRLTGYYEVTNTTGNGTNECQMFFSGKFQKNTSIDVVVFDAHKNSFSIKPNHFNGKIVFQMKGSKQIVIFYPSEKSWSCEWLYDGLPSYIPPKGFNIRDGLLFEFVRSGDFVAANVVGVKRAHFYNEPNESSVRKAFLIDGDFIYVYEEKPGWYYAKFQSGKKETVGWIRKSDTIQLVE